MYVVPLGMLGSPGGGVHCQLRFDQMRENRPEKSTLNENLMVT